MTSEVFPKTIYKFRDLRSCYHLDTIQYRSMYFAPPSSLNDPFDLALNYRFDKMSKDKLIDYFTVTLSYNYAYVSERERRRVVEEKIRGTTPEELAKAYNLHARNYAEKAYGVSSTASTWKSILMWSHYSDSHKGFCVGYDFEVLDSFFGEHYLRPLHIFASHVQYTNDQNILPGDEPRERQAERLLTTKYSGWEYEQEIRFLLLPVDESELDVGKRIVTVPEAAITEVILGWRMRPDEKDKIKKILRDYERKPRLYVIEDKIGQFELQRREIFY